MRRFCWKPPLPSSVRLRTSWKSACDWSSVPILKLMLSLTLMRAWASARPNASRKRAAMRPQAVVRRARCAEIGMRAFLLFGRTFRITQKIMEHPGEFNR